MCITVSTCHQNVTESIAQLKDTDHTRSYDTKNTPVHFTATANQVSRSSLVGSPGELSVFAVATGGRLSHSLLMPDLCHD